MLGIDPDPSALWPEALARWVLGGLGGWTPARIAAAMRAGRESSVPLAQPIPVSISWLPTAGSTAISDTAMLIRRVS